MTAPSALRLICPALLTFSGLTYADSIVFNIGTDPAGTDSTTFCPGSGGCQTQSGGIKVLDTAFGQANDIESNAALGINSYSVIRNPSSGGVYQDSGICDRCILRFTSGPAQQGASNPPYSFTFGPGSGSFDLTGYVVPPSGPNTPNSPPSIANGGPQTNTFTVNVPGGATPGNTGSFSQAAVFLVNYLNPTLAGNFGILPGPYKALLYLSFKVATGAADPNHPGFSSDLTNTTGQLFLTQAPEPMTLAMIGFGLIAMGWLGRRRRHSSQG